jgi:hypothetical protein
VTPPRHDDETINQDEIDPTHIIALGVRVGNLAQALDALRQQVAELDNDVSDRLPTKEQHTEIVAILGERAGRKWFQSRLRFYGWGLLAFLGGIFVIRDYISSFLTWVSRVVK